MGPPVALFIRSFKWIETTLAASKNGKKGKAFYRLWKRRKLSRIRLESRRGFRIILKLINIG
jgi:hypothetical protein